MEEDLTLALIVIVALLSLPLIQPAGRVVGVQEGDVVITGHPLTASEQIELYDAVCARLRNQCIGCAGANVCRHYCYRYEAQCANIQPLYGAFRN